MVKTTMNVYIEKGTMCFKHGMVNDTPVMAIRNTKHSYPVGHTSKNEGLDDADLILYFNDPEGIDFMIDVLKKLKEEMATTKGITKA